MMAQLFIVVFGLGLPMALLSYLLLHWSYESGWLSRDSDNKAHRAALKEMKKAARKKDIPGANFVTKKWLRFGGGCYGAAGLWTLLAAELADLFSLIINWPGIGQFFAGGPVNFLVGFIKNQVQNFVTAITWFDYWSDVAGDANIGLVFLVAVGGYSLGKRAAKAGWI